MTFKKVLSAVMAGAMVLSMGLTAFATAATPSGQVALEGEEVYEIEVGGATQVATIKVQVPEVVGFIVNPYKLDAKNEEIGIGTTGNTAIVSPLQKIVNKSDFKISVGGKVYGVENSEEAKLKAALTTPSGTTKAPKEAVINFLDMKGGNAATTRLDKDTSGVASVNPTTTETGVDLTAVELDKASGTNDAYLFNFDGDATADPATAWTAGDTFGATISFTFTAVANAAPSNP